MLKALKSALLNRGYQHLGTQKDETSAAEEDLSAATSPAKNGKGSTSLSRETYRDRIPEVKLERRERGKATQFFLEQESSPG